MDSQSINHAEKFEYWPLHRIIPYSNNARVHTEEHINQLAASIIEFGFNAPLLVDKDCVLLAGHGRLLAAQHLGLVQVPVVQLFHLTPDQRRAYRLADNRLAECSSWDQDRLALELEELSGVFDLGLLGFDETALSTLVEQSESISPSVNDSSDISDEPELPDPPANPVSLPGDIWQLGPHRLMCGDSTDKQAVDLLMDGESAVLCFTSPPYYQQRKYVSAINDWNALMQGVFLCLPLRIDAQVLVNLGLIHRHNCVVPYWDGWIQWMQQQGWRHFGWYVWDQGPGLPGGWAGRLAPSHEFVFHFNKSARHPNKIVPCKYAGQDEHLRPDGTASSMRGKDGKIGNWSHVGKAVQDFRIPDSVIRIQRQKGAIGKDIDHPAVFPVSLPEHVMLAYSDAGDVVYEPFNGSGSSLIAGQRTGRIVRGMEIAPSYVDVSLKRFLQHFSHIQPILSSTGQTFLEVSAARGGHAA